MPRAPAKTEPDAPSKPDDPTANTDGCPATPVGASKAHSTSFVQRSQGSATPSAAKLQVPVTPAAGVKPKAPAVPAGEPSVVPSRDPQSPSPAGTQPRDLSVPAAAKAKGAAATAVEQSHSASPADAGKTLATFVLAASEVFTNKADLPSVLAASKPQSDATPADELIQTLVANEKASSAPEGRPTSVSVDKHTSELVEEHTTVTAETPVPVTNAPLLSAHAASLGSRADLTVAGKENKVSTANLMAMDHVCDSTQQGRLAALLK